MLTKATTVLAVLFMLGALALAIMGQRGPGSLVSGRGARGPGSHDARRAGRAGARGDRTAGARGTSGGARAAGATTVGRVFRPRRRLTIERPPSLAEVAELADAPA